MSEFKNWLICVLFFVSSSLREVEADIKDRSCQEFGCPYYYPEPLGFVPAAPGGTPKCAKPGTTFCESLDSYPRQAIEYLVKKQYPSIEKFIRQESRENFDGLRKPENQGYYYTKSKVPVNLYPSEYLRRTPQSNYSSFPRNDIEKDSLPPVYSNGPAAELYHKYYSPNASPWTVTNSYNTYNARLNNNEKPGFNKYENPFESYLRTNNKGKRQKRQFTDPTSVSLCPTISNFITPRAALNNEGNWMYIVNLDNNMKYQQLVRTEVCRGDKCDGICSLPLGYASKCQQQYVQKRLIALEGSGNQLLTDVFWLPHGCNCMIMNNDDV